MTLVRGCPVPQMVPGERIVDAIEGQEPLAHGPEGLVVTRESR